MANYIKSASFNYNKKFTSSTSNDLQTFCSFPKFSLFDDTYECCESALNYGFAALDDHVFECLVCGQKLKNNSMIVKESKKHFINLHGNLISKLLYDYFSNLHHLKIQSVDQTVEMIQNKQIVSYKVAKMIVDKVQPYTISETLILPACKEIVKCMFGNNAEKIMNVPLSNHSIYQCIREMSSDVQKQLIEKLHNKKFSLQLDVSGNSQVLSYIRFIDGDSIVQQFFASTELLTTSNIVEFYSAMTTTLIKHKLCWENCVSICIDCVFIEIAQNFVSCLKKVFPCIQITHNFSSREYLIKYTIPGALKNVLYSVVKMIKYIRIRPADYEVFNVLCQETGNNTETLIFNSYSRWMSRTNILAKFYDNRSELLKIFMVEKPKFAMLIKNKQWCSKLAYLVDILECVNKFSTEKDQENIFKFNDKLQFFLMTLRVWIEKVKIKDFTMFPRTYDTNIDISNLIANHLSSLEKELQKYFPSFEVTQYSWVCNPFTINSKARQYLSVEKTKELTKLWANQTLQLKFKEKTLFEFWNEVKNEFPLLAEDALCTFIHFSSSELLELGFSIFLNITHKKRDGPYSIDEELRVRLSMIQPRFELLCNSKEPSS